MVNLTKIYQNIKQGGLDMSICDAGIKDKVCGGKLTINITEQHPLVLLAKSLPWEQMYTLILPDLKNTTKRKQWWRGRKLKVRIHLGAYILQQMYNKKDREMEADLKENAAYQLFCGHGIVKNWHSPDHTKIETFRSRLSPETQQQLANLTAQHAVKLGIAEPSVLDVDSTVQQANITYPTDAKMLRKIGDIASKVATVVKGIIPKAQQGEKALHINIKEIASRASACFFLSKKATHEEKAEKLTQLLEAVSSPVKRIISACKDISHKAKDKLSWDIQRAIDQLLSYGETYFESVKAYIKTGKSVQGKTLSFHAKAVACFNKGKDHKKYEFGRAYQIGRIQGNILYVGKCTSIRMEDKQSLGLMIEEHEKIFEHVPLDSVATDKGYYSKQNIKILTDKKVRQIGIQLPNNAKSEAIKLSDEESEKLRNRRAGIEPLIGHTKHGGQLGQSRMKNDKNTESSGYCAILGFNLRQVKRALIRNYNDQCVSF